MEQTGRNHSIDTLKAIAAFLIVMLHCTIDPVPDHATIYTIVVRTISRCAVPLFFMITGYYIPTIMQSKEHERRYFKKILIITIGTSMFYNILKILMVGAPYVHQVFSQETLVNLLLLNRDPFGLHIWYLHALIYTLIIVKIITTFSNPKTLYAIAAGLIIAIIAANYCGYGMYTRNFVTGIACTSIGIFVRNNAPKTPHLKTATIIIATVTVAEGLFFELFLNQINEIYFTTIPLAACCLSLAVNAGNRPLSKPARIVSTVGHRYSTLIYVFHIFFFLLFCRYLDTTIPAINLALPFIVYLTTLLFAKTIRSNGLSCPRQRT